MTGAWADYHVRRAPPRGWLIANAHSAGPRFSGNGLWCCWVVICVPLSVGCCGLCVLGVLCCVCGVSETIPKSIKMASKIDKQSKAHPAPPGNEESTFERKRWSKEWPIKCRRINPLGGSQGFWRSRKNYKNTLIFEAVDLYNEEIQT